MQVCSAHNDLKEKWISSNFSVSDGCMVKGMSLQGEFNSEE